MKKIFNYIKQMLLGLRFLHAKGILHNDIKPGNIFLDKKGRVKIGDLGSCTKIRKPEYKSGTLYY